MFWSKIWFFLVAVVAALAITVALVMPRPAERAAVAAEGKRLRRACAVTNILLRDNARARIQLASEFAQAVRQLKLSDTLFEASKGNIVSAEANATGRTELNELVESVSGTKPSFVVLLDRKGRVVARAGLDDKSYGESLRGYFLVDEVLGGYLRDDLWILDGVIYRVAGAPVLTRQLDWAGGIVLGQAIDSDFVGALADNLGADIGFYIGGEPVATSTSTPIHKEIVASAQQLVDLPPGTDCDEGELVEATSGGDRYTAVGARLPGEAGALGAFYSIFVEQDTGRGFLASLEAVKKNDLSFGKFPWIRVALLFLVAIGVGLALMILEADRPLRRLNKDAIGVAQGDQERLAEEQHRGKFGSIARSVNIAIDKLHRETRAAKKDLDQLLGPAPAGGGSGPSALPPVGPSGPAPGPIKPPPPSEFRFSGGVADAPIAPPPPSPGLPTPPPAGERTPPPVPKPPAAPGPLGRPTDEQVPPKPVALPSPPPPVKAIDEDILADEEDEESGGNESPTRIFDGPRGASGEPLVGGEDAEEGHFRAIFDEFLDLKRQCGENVDNLTFERFAAKLTKNRDALIAKHGCASVRFQVYEKDGKAALKASPVR